MHTIFFGLLSALTWGASDFTGGMVSRRTGALRAVLFAEAFGLAVLLGIVAIFGEPLIHLKDFLWSALAGTVGSLGLLFLYHALATGQMSLAAPVSAVTAAALPILAGSFLAGLPQPATLLGFLLALPAIWLISQSQSGSSSQPLRLAGLGLPLLSGLGFGLYFIFMNQGSQEALLWPMIASRAAGTITIALILSFKRERWLPQSTLWPLFLLNACLDVGGNAFFILAGQAGRLDVAAVLGSLYPALTVLLAWLLLRERIAPRQLLGILVALVAIALMTI